jgi:hypothetical protein
MKTIPLAKLRERPTASLRLIIGVIFIVTAISSQLFSRDGATRTAMGAVGLGPQELSTSTNARPLLQSIDKKATISVDLPTHPNATGMLYETKS